jgi:hypothetical protein
VNATMNNSFLPSRQWAVTVRSNETTSVTERVAVASRYRALQPTARPALARIWNPGI